MGPSLVVGENDWFQEIPEFLVRTWKVLRVFSLAGQKADSRGAQLVNWHCFDGRTFKKSEGQEVPTVLACYSTV